MVDFMSLCQRGQFSRSARNRNTSSGAARTTPLTLTSTMGGMIRAGQAPAGPFERISASTDARPPNGIDIWSDMEHDEPLESVGGSPRSPKEASMKYMLLYYGEMADDEATRAHGMELMAEW